MQVWLVWPVGRPHCQTALNQGWRCCRKDSSQAGVFTWMLPRACAVRHVCVQGNHMHAHVCASPCTGASASLRCSEESVTPTGVCGLDPWAPPGPLPTLRSPGPKLGARTTPVRRDKEELGGCNRRTLSWTEEGTMSTPPGRCHQVRLHKPLLRKLGADVPPLPRAGVAQHPNCKGPRDPTFVPHQVGGLTQGPATSFVGLKAK